MIFAVYAGAAPTVRADFATVAVSVRNARNLIMCTVPSAATATPPMQTVRWDTITVRNAVSSACSVRIVCMKKVSTFAKIAAYAYTAVLITRSQRAVIAENTVLRVPIGTTIFAPIAEMRFVPLRCVKNVSFALTAVRATLIVWIRRLSA